MLHPFIFKSNTAVSVIDSIGVQSSCISIAQNSTINSTSNISSDNWQDTAIDSIMDTAAHTYRIAKNFLLTFLHKFVTIPRAEAQGIGI